MATSPQRAYRAACPNCGAPVEFASAASASAVCGFCRSTLVRDGEALLRIGTSAELFDDHSPLQLGAGGVAQGLRFTLVGRLQYGYAEGTWNEWHALFDNGRSAWLSEDNGAYVLAFDAPLPADAPALDSLAAGQRVMADGRVWDVASVVQAKLIAAQGELPRPPQLHGEFRVVDLRNGAGEVATLDGSDPGAIGWSVGRSVLLGELQMQGLAEAKEKTLGSRGVGCPSCGNALAVTLASTKSVSCSQCNAVVDLSAGPDGGVGGQLQYYAQNNSGAGGLEPQIALGRTGSIALGTAQALPWQVVGYQERCDIPDSSEDETTFWREYLLYNREHGFAFLVDAEDGWSWVRPITGAPQVKGDTATYRGAGYKKRYSYAAKVTWVQGEFYWRVTRDERAQVTDYDGTGADSRKRLSREQTRSATGTEVVWSAGAVLEAAVVAQAFDVPVAQRAAMQRDAAPLSGSKLGTGKVVMIVLLILVLMFVLSECSGGRCDDVRQAYGPNSNEYRQCVASSSSRTSGGSGGGWSSGGGGHK